MSFPTHRSVLTAIVCAIVGHASMARGQVSATLDASGMHTAFDGAGSAGSFVVSPTFRLDRDALGVDVSGTLSRFADSWTGQAALDASYFAHIVGPIQTEIDVNGNSSAQRDVAGTGTAGGGIRLHWLGQDRGLWLGAQANRATDGATWRSTTAGDAGGWLRAGSTTAVLQLAPTAIGSDLRYFDVSATARTERGRMEVIGSVGLRDWHEPADVATNTWGTLTALVWLGDHLAITAAGGSYPADWAQGFGAGKYVTVGLRVATHRPTSRQAVSNAIQRTLPPVPRPIVEGFSVRCARASQCTVYVTAPAADRVDIMGDFTNWQSVSLERRASGQWSATLAIAPGTHRLNLRVGSDPWGVPPGLPIVTDEFNGAVALLTVE